MTAEQHQKPSRRRTERDDDAERNRLEKALEIGLEDTFPASDAVAGRSARANLRDYLDNTSDCTQARSLSFH